MRHRFVSALVKLLSAVLIFGFLFAISIPKFSNTREKAYQAAFKSALRRGLVRSNADFHTESYDKIVENRFLMAEVNPLSTFSIDVDRASYGNVRRFISQGQRPPVDAVRIEELVNYFPYDYPEPTDEHPFSITTEVAAAPWNPVHRLVRIGLKGRSADLTDLPPSNLVFLIDVSGSMHAPDKLPLVKAAMRLLVNALRAEDRVAIVVYAGAAGLALPSVPGDYKALIMAAIDALEAGGSTAGGDGIELAYEVAQHYHVPGGNNRVILATDGDFNLGTSSDGALVRLIEKKRGQGTFLTVLGFGSGNLKDSKMEKLADHGNGNFAYIDNMLEARKVLVTEFGGTLFTIAKDVKVQVEFNPDRVSAYRLIGYENRTMAAEEFNDDRKDAGELGAGHTVTALYEIIPASVESPTSAGRVDALRYRGVHDRLPPAQSNELALVKLRYKDPDGVTSRLIEHVVVDRAGEPSHDFVFAAAVAGFGMLLRDSEHCGSWTMADALSAAQASVGRDPHGYRTEFVRLVEVVAEGGMLAQ